MEELDEINAYANDKEVETVAENGFGDCYDVEFILSYYY